MVDLSPETVEQAIRATPPATPEWGDEAVPAIVRVTSKVFGVTEGDLLGPSREQQFAMARQVAMAVARATTPLSFPAIGTLFGRDHSTVMHAVQRVLEDDRMRSYAAAVLEAMNEEETRGRD